MDTECRNYSSLKHWNYLPSPIEIRLFLFFGVFSVWSRLRIGFSQFESSLRNEMGSTVTRKPCETGSEMKITGRAKNAAGNEGRNL
jgi:hypothetical protein